MSESPRVITSAEAGVAYVTLDNPSRGNALTRGMYEQLNAAWRWIEADDSIRVLVFSAVGDRHLCTGADVAALDGELRSPGEPFTLTWRQAGVTKPAIVAVNGTAAGGGLGFVADGDIVVAAENARFLDPHVNVGQIGAYGALQLVGLIGLSEATRIALAGGVLDARRAHTLGLVNELEPDADAARARAAALAAAIVKASPTAVAVTRALQLAHAARAEQQAALELANEAWNRHFGHPDATEGPRAYLEKRPPQWSTRR